VIFKVEFSDKISSFGGVVGLRGWVVGWGRVGVGEKKGFGIFFALGGGCVGLFGGGGG